MHQSNIQCVLRAVTLAVVAVSAAPSNAENSDESLIEETIVRGSYLQSSEVSALAFSLISISLFLHSIKSIVRLYLCNLFSVHTQNLCVLLSSIL